MRNHFANLAQYNRWANGRLYDAVATLSPAEYGRDRKGFFRSVQGTLNHILVGDRLWLRRLTGEGSQPRTLNQILYETFAELRPAREDEDERILRVVGGCSEEALSGNLAYENYRGQRFEQPLWQVLDHVFNHQTHHRGQVHDMLSQTGMDPPELDLIYFLREGDAAATR